jgi:hypothetical protein
VALSPQANYTDWANATFRRNLMPTFVDRGVSRGQRGGSPRSLVCFLYRSRYLISSSSSFILTRTEWTQFQTHCYSENLVAPGTECGTSGLAARNSDQSKTEFFNCIKTWFPTIKLPRKIEIIMGLGNIWFDYCNIYNIYNYGARNYMIWLL